MRRLTLLLVLFATPVVAEPLQLKTQAIYVDALGKGGLWGLGYDLRLTPRFVVGAVGSMYVLGGDRFTTFSPYVGVYPIAGAHHGWFAHVGPQLQWRTTASPGPEWSGMTTSGIGAELSSGYEYRNHVVLRLYGMAAVGARVVPWVGASFGWSL
jgi:hypothetical protein